MKKEILRKIFLGLILASLAATFVQAQQRTIPESTDLPGFLRKIADYLFWILTLVAVIMIVWGAFMFATAAGDEKKLGAARDTVLWAIIAVVVAILSRSIVNFIADQLR